MGDPACWLHLLDEDGRLPEPQPEADSEAEPEADSEAAEKPAG